MVFFVISGFLITTLLLREEADQQSIRLGRFFQRRALRILPAAFTYLAVLGLLEVTVGIGVSWKELLISAGFIRNAIGGGEFTNHFWSLSIEEQFYIIWPLLLFAVAHQHWPLPWVLGLLLALSLSLNLYLVQADAVAAF